MPVQRVTAGGRPGFRWGDAGATYTYREGDAAGEERARMRAEEQGRVIEARMARAMTRTFAPPRPVREAAKRALELRASLPASRRGMTAVGIARARDLANGREVSMETILRMRSYFARHAVDAEGGGWGEDSPGWQAWLGWGGDPGRDWAERIASEYLEP